MKEKVIALIEEVLMLPTGTIKEDTMMEDVPEWDSLAHVLLVGEIESKLGVSIPLEEAIEITGVKDILEKVGA